MVSHESRLCPSRPLAVDECEIKVIKETFKDLCHLNGGSMRIDKETFLQYLPLPGLLGGTWGGDRPRRRGLTRRPGLRRYFFFMSCSGRALPL